VVRAVKPRNYWAEAENCRKLFDGFAKERQFNPLDPNNWYSVTSSDFAGKVVPPKQPYDDKITN